MYHRIARLEEGPFKPLADEQDSEDAVNNLLIAGFTVPIMASIFQTGFAYLYFWFGHAWSRLLRKYAYATLDEEHQTTANLEPLRGEQGSKHGGKDE